MKLIEAQREFTERVARLIDYARKLGFQPRLGEVYRTLEQARLNAQRGTGIVNSNHTRRLAVDLILDNERGEWLTHTEDYRALGEWWEQCHPLARWGGRFARPDGNHFSFEWDGVK